MLTLPQFHHLCHGQSGELWSPESTDSGQIGNCFSTGWAEGFYSDSNQAGYGYYSALDPGRSLTEILDTIVIHHEGNDQRYSVQSVQDSHMWDIRVDRYWVPLCDISSRTIYEGRDIRVRGAHVEGANTGKVGLLLLGDFQPDPTISVLGLTIFRDSDDIGPTLNQIQSAADLIRWLNFLYGINSVVGHRDLNNTECPADYCLPYIPYLMKQHRSRK